MSATATAHARVSRPAGRLARGTRQAVDSFVAAQNIVLDLTAQQNELAMGVLRERLAKPRIHPGRALASVADKSVAGLTGAGKILLDLAAGESAVVMDVFKEGLRLRPAAGAIADVIRGRVDALIDMQKHLLDAAAEQTHAVTESYKQGKGLAGTVNVAELARRGVEDFVKT